MPALGRERTFFPALRKEWIDMTHEKSPSLGGADHPVSQHEIDFAVDIARLANFDVEYAKGALEDWRRRVRTRRPPEGLPPEYIIDDREMILLKAQIQFLEQWLE